MNAVGRRCTRCVMDSSARDITFDAQGCCNFCTEFLAAFGHEKPATQKEVERAELLSKIKREGAKKAYDCIIGLSGGVDSTYTLLLAKKNGLRPLAVHLDNGWNSELASHNIAAITKKLDVPLYTHVIDWQETMDLQLAFMRAGVVDIELMMDNAMLALNYRMAAKYGLTFILSGSNSATEGMTIPREWNHYKFDARNIRSIHKAFGKVKIRTQPLFSTLRFAYYKFCRGIEWTHFLDYFDYVKENAIETLKAEADFHPYPYKHYESVFTRFYQGYLLPAKFGIDKRKVHFSNLICSNQLSREEALAKLAEDPYPDPQQKQSDLLFVLKKLRLSEEDWLAYIAKPGVPHERYLTEKPLFLALKRLKERISLLSAWQRR